MREWLVDRDQTHVLSLKQLLTEVKKSPLHPGTGTFLKSSFLMCTFLWQVLSLFRASLQGKERKRRKAELARVAAVKRRSRWIDLVSYSNKHWSEEALLEMEKWKSSIPWTDLLKQLSKACCSAGILQFSPLVPLLPILNNTSSLYSNQASKWREVENFRSHNQSP